MKQERVFPKYLNLAITLVAIATFICVLFVHFSESGLKTVMFLVGDDYQVFQDHFINTTCLDYPFMGYLFIVVLYAVMFITLIDLIISPLMFIPAVRKNSFMALLYKTFLIFYGIIQILLCILAIIFSFFYFAYCSRSGLSVAEFFDAQNNAPIFAILIISILSLGAMGGLKLVTYRNYKRPE